MKNTFCWIKLCFLCLFFMFSCSDSDATTTNSKSLSVMNWNLETFFDGVFDGNEYSDFKNAKNGWSNEKYKVRLERLSNVVKELDCDVLVMEELEKKEQLYDITNQLSGTFNFSKIYKYGFFASEENASIGCGILSRFPISDVKVHKIDMRTSQKQPSMRPIIELSINAGEENLCLFVNHWKSKSGGAEQSEIFRDAQEKQLSRLIKKALLEGKKILACGDFNRSIEEFKYEKNGENNVVLKGGTRVFSPWFDDDDNLNETGSYWYKNNWEYIDNFFSANVKIENFVSHNSGEWVDANGHPNRYKIYSGKGYSDHLPITCVVNFD